MIYLLIDGTSKLETTSHTQDGLVPQQEMSDEEESDDEVSTSAPPYSFSQETTPSTPKKTTQVCARDTPRVGRVQDNPEFKSSYVERQRRELIASLGWECFSDTIEYFFEHVLPPLQPDLKVDEIYKECIERRVLVENGQPGRYKWKKLTDTPGQVGSHETQIYNKPLRHIFNKIAKIAEELSPRLSPLTRKSFFRADGNKCTWSEKNIASKPDAHVFVITPGNGYPNKGDHWYNVACSFQFKKKNSKKKIYEVFYVQCHI